MQGVEQALITRTLIATFESDNAARAAARELTEIGVPEDSISLAQDIERGTVLRTVVYADSSDSAVEILNRHGALPVETRSEGVDTCTGSAAEAA